MSTAQERLFLGPVLAGGFPSAEEFDRAAVINPNLESRVSILLLNLRPVQAWSFGVSTDASAVHVAGWDLEGTTTAALNSGKGPTFLEVDVHPGGVTMAAVVDEQDLEDVIPANHRGERGPRRSLGSRLGVG